MKTRPFVILCWIQVVVGAAFVLLTFYNNLTRPTLQLDYSKMTGIVSDVAPSGAADLAGLRAGDRLLSINGVTVQRGINPLFFSRAGDNVPIIATRASPHSRWRIGRADI